MADFKATSEQWADAEYYGDLNRNPRPVGEYACILELRSRIENLEAERGAWKAVEKLYEENGEGLKQLAEIEVAERNANDPYSPETRRVADAFWRASLGKPQTFKNDMKALAAALRAVAEVCVPDDSEGHWVYIPHVLTIANELGETND